MPMKNLRCFAFILIATAAMQAGAQTVTSLNDDGPGTLRNVLANAVEFEVIDFDSSLNGIIVLESSLPAITQQFLTIHGPSEGGITVDGDSQFRIFNVVANNFTADNLTLSNGADSGQGGAIFLGQAIDVFFTNMVIVPASGANGLNPMYIDTDATLHLEDSAVTSTANSNVYLNQGSLFVTANSLPVQYMVDGVGGGAMYKYGSDSMNLTVPPSTTPDFVIAVYGGELIFNGAIVEPAIVLTGGALQGEFSSDYIINNGFLQAGDEGTIAEIDSSGTYYQNAPGELKVTITPSGDADLIAMHGDVLISGGTLTIIPQSGVYLMGTTYTFMTSDGIVTGAFDSVVSDGVDVQINYNAQSIEIQVLNTTTI